MKAMQLLFPFPRPAMLRRNRRARIGDENYEEPSNSFTPITVVAVLALLVSAAAIVIALVAITNTGDASSTPPSGKSFLDIDFRVTDLDLDDTFGYLMTPPSPASPAPINYIIVPNSIQASMTNPNVTDDGVATRDPTLGLVIDSSIFLQRRPSIFDHPKYLTLTQQPTTPAAGSRLVLESTISMYSTNVFDFSAPQSGTQLAIANGLFKYSSGIVNPRDDPRIACVALNLLDLQHGMVYDFIISNRTIFALYEHLPFTDDTAVFTYAVPVGTRPADVSAYTHYAIEYDTALNDVVWYIDHTEVFRVTQPGLPLPRPEYLVFLRSVGGTVPEFKPVTSTSFNIGFGTFSLLDFLPFWGTYDPVGYNNMTVPGSGPSVPISSLSDLPSLFPTDGLPYFRVPTPLGEYVPVESIYTADPMNPSLDGQGAVMIVRDVKVYQRGG